MKPLAVGILAHVDAGKTTLSEAVLYQCGVIRKLGRVDRKDAFFDTDSQERRRGITIFSKQARLSMGEFEVTLLDTPGHADFSAEMERTLQVLDYAVLVISGSDGVQGHTYTLWQLLKRYQIPTFVFLNKMDQPGTDKEFLLRQLRGKLGEGFVDFTQKDRRELLEELAVCEEQALEHFLESGQLPEETIRKMIACRRVFPCFFGSALRDEGVKELIEGISRLAMAKVYPEAFGARVFKITRDGQGNRLTHMKITGGCLKTRQPLSGAGKDETGSYTWEEKVSQIRFYNGEKFELQKEAMPGSICAVTGLSRTFAGEGLGMEAENIMPVLEPVLSYGILLPEGCDPVTMLPKLRELCEEEPELQIDFDEKSRTLRAKLMGQVQIEVLQELIRDRFGIQAAFGTGAIVYKETIKNTVEGVGHFEPLRHYAEVHLLMEPLEAGSGLVFETACSEDLLDRNWQRLILTHLEEKEHRGVLTGSVITDMKITLVSGKAHQKHTEGGDFRQAVYRALRQGLMQAECELLEPWYEFSLTVPQQAVGRAMADLEKKKAVFAIEATGEEETTLSGVVPLSELQDYQTQVASYTAGKGQLSCRPKGYFPCRDKERVLLEKAYDPERDVENPADSVFCSHGAGVVVKWDQVPLHMHLDSCLMTKDQKEEAEGKGPRGAQKQEETFLGIEEIDAILQRAAGANGREERSSRKEGWKREKRKQEAATAQKRVYKPMPKKDRYLLVDGYNVIFAWPELNELAKVNLDGARGRLLDILCNYQAIRQVNLIAVFDAYRLAGHPTEYQDYHNIHVVYTKEAETADRYIERFAHENAQKYDVTVATSDGMEQIIIVGEGCHLISSRELQEEILQASREILEDYQRSQNI